MLASITVVNVSDEYLNDWYIEWNYRNATEIKYIYNAILSSYEPYRAKSPEVGRAAAPGAMTTLNMLLDVPEKIAENPTVIGNYCF